jgi:hypothetical protein
VNRVQVTLKEGPGFDPGRPLCFFPAFAILCFRGPEEGFVCMCFAPGGKGSSRSDCVLYDYAHMEIDARTERTRSAKQKKSKPKKDKKNRL